ncbi:MAG: AsmA-like C-terminal region-containing protein, partial [Balneolaceae bacterium]
EDITFLATIEGPRLVIGEARFRTGENRLSMSGTVDDYLDDDPLFDLTIDGSAILADIASYYPLEPWINELTGGAQMDLNARGPAGEPTRIALNGTLELTDVVARGDSLNLPVTNLNGVLAVRPDAMTLESFFMNFGSSDISLEGRLENYLGFMQEYDSEAAMPSVSGTYHSRLLDMDEMMDWDEETGEEPLPVELPRMTGTVDTRIDSLTLFGIYITDIEGRGRTNPDQLVIEDATASMFDGSASGSFTWNVPRPDRTNLRFSGSLEDLQVEAFFREFPILGENSRFERHLTGGFDAEADYYTELDEFITPDISTTTAEGSFGMSRARMQGHPFQENLADWLGADELRSLALDEWTATFSIRESVLTLNDFRLTSENIGLELDGTQHLETDEIDFTAQLFLPSGFRSGLSSVLSSRVVDALTNDEGLIVVPLRISGTMENPRFTPQESIIEDLLRDTGRDILRGLFN